MSSPLEGKVGLVDGDILAYRASAVAEKKWYLVNIPGESPTIYENHKEAKKAANDDLRCIWNQVEDKGLDFALEACKTSIENIRNKTKAVELDIWFSGENNSRLYIAVTQPYKGNRTQPKPKYLNSVKEFLRNEYGARITDLGEADDMLGIRSGEFGDASFICTLDKDLDQIPGWHYNWVDDRTYKVSKKEADFNFYRQVLSGDPTDNVPGLPGVGDKIASSILEGATSRRDLFERTWRSYCDRAGKGSIKDTWRYFVEQSNLIFIPRDLNGYWLPVFVPEEVLEVYQ